MSHYGSEGGNNAPAFALYQMFRSLDLSPIRMRPFCALVLLPFFDPDGITPLRILIQSNVVVLVL